jgi:hypothetical protein
MKSFSLKHYFLLLLAALFILNACEPGKKEKQSAADSSVVAPIVEKVKEEVIQHKEDKRMNAIALYLAGLPQEKESPFLNLEKNQAWKDYARQADARWAAFNSHKLTRMGAWAEKELKTVREETKTILYPFSGPDFLNAFTFFPTADKFNMIGLEPIGLIPDIEKIPKDSLPNYFHSVQQSLASILSLSFFKTIDMAVDFKSEQLDGIVTDLFIFIVRTGNKIIDTRPIAINDQGQPVTSNYVSAAKVDKKGIYGIQITFETKEGQQKTLNYFSADLWDHSLEQHTGFLNYLQNLGSVTSYLKSASYLMHKNYFSVIRGILLKQSKYLLQDDSGIPYHFFVPKVWDIKLYGTYDKPIKLFKDWYQEDLKAAYKDSTKKIPGLNFGIGYNFQVSESNLMLLQKK